ncbi:MAG: HNH endonuclease [Oscillospiraceae bacterium]|nr:HNH endonuclease [Oscillospiraceae bacterium]MBQ9939292.1 HNH endonuclease [Oscillospiraceae bacterium]
MPEKFPYHPHWKMDECHNAYWELIPTVDHIYPIALGGEDSEENYATTSMLHNSIKNNWTLEQLQWTLYPAGNYDEWDGLTNLFILLVEQNKELLKDAYIKRWYAISKIANK